MINKFQHDVDDIGKELQIIKKTFQQQQQQQQQQPKDPYKGSTLQPPTMVSSKPKITSFRTNRGGTTILDTIQKNQNYSAKGIESFATDRRPYVAETLYHYEVWPIDKILRGGKAKPYHPIIINAAATNETSPELVWPARNESEAICTIRHIGFGVVNSTPTLDDQIPHHMQQLWRCLSWWQLNPHQKPVLHTEMDYRDPTQEVRNRHYILSMHKALKEVFDVRIDVVRKKSNAPTVTVDVPYWRNFRTLIDTYMMNSPDAKLLRERFLNHYFPTDSRPAGGCPKSDNNNSTSANGKKKKQPKPTILSLNREGARRALGNHKEVYTALKLAGYRVVYLQNFNELTLLEQVQVMARVDILMGPHGAQFTNTLFQPECGSLLEFFGHNYYVPNFFGSLARLSGKHHFFTFNNGAVTDQEHDNRNNPPFKVNPEVVVQMTHIMVDRWNQCCQIGGFENSHKATSGTINDWIG